MSTESPSSRWGVALPALESVSLVVLGVAATKLPSLWALGLIVAAAIAVVLARVIASGPTREQRAHEWLEDYSKDRVALFSILQTVGRYVDSRHWATHHLASAINWWMDEDLIPDYYWDEEATKREQEAQKRFIKWRKPAMVQRIRAIPRRVRTWFYRLERNANPSLTLIDVVYRLGSDRVARTLLFAALREDFVSETVVHGKCGGIQRKYQFCEGIMTAKELRAIREQDWAEEDEPESEPLPASPTDS